MSQNSSFRKCSHRKFRWIALLTAMAVGIGGSAVATAAPGLPEGDPLVDLMIDTGFLNADGSLRTDHPIYLDGRAHSLEEIKALIDDPSTDLSQIAQVAGTPIALGDLQTMIEIERWVQRYGEAIDGPNFTPEQAANLTSLLTQLETQGLQSLNAAAIEPASAIVPEFDHSAFIQVCDPAATVCQFDFNEGVTTPSAQGRPLMFWSENPQQTALVEWQVLPGTIAPGKWAPNVGFGPYGPHSLPIDVVISNHWSTAQVRSVLDAERNSQPSPHPDVRVYHPGQIELAYEAMTLHVIPRGPLTVFPNAADLWTGTRSFFIQISNPVNADLRMPGATSPGLPLGHIPAVTIPVNLHSNPARTVSATATMPTGNIPTSLTGLLVRGVFNWNNSIAELASIYETLGSSSFITEFRLQPSANPDFQEDAACPEPVSGGVRISTQDFWVYDQLYNRTFTDSKECYLSSSGTQSWVNVGWRTTQLPVGLQVQFIAPVARLPQFNLREIVHCGLAGETCPPWGFSRGSYPLFPTVVMTNDSRPQVVGVTTPHGTFPPGALVPITVQFNQPVYGTNARIQVLGAPTPLEPYRPSASSQHLFSNRQTFLYRVPATGDQSLVITEVSGAQNIFGTSMHRDETRRDFGTNVKFDTYRFVDALSAPTVPVNPSLRSVLDGGVRVTLPLNAAYLSQLNGFAFSNNGLAPFTVRIPTLTSVEVQATLRATGNTVYATADFPAAVFTPQANDRAHRVEVLVHDNPANPAANRLVLRAINNLNVQGIVWATAANLTLGGFSSAELELSLADGSAPRLTITPAADVTCAAGTWESSNEQIATIDDDGQIILTGNAVGDVYFTYTATNLNLGLTPPTRIDSPVFTVTAGDAPSLVIPREASAVIVLEGNPTTVRWVSNAAHFPVTGNPNFRIDLFAGEHTLSELAALQPIASQVAPLDKNSTQFSATEANTISVGGRASYTARVRVPHPFLLTGYIEAIAHIFVRSVPATVALERTGTAFMLDNATQRLDVTIDNAPAGLDGRLDGEFDLEIVRSNADGSHAVVATLSNENLVRVGETNSWNASIVLDPSPVQGLRATYAVNARVRNRLDAHHSIDSMVINVYNAGAMRLVGENVVDGRLVMDNRPLVAGQLPTDSAGIFSLREQLGLIEFVGINHTEHAWQQLADVMRWSTSDPNAVSVNYRVGALYVDIANLAFDVFLPQAQMALLGSPYARNVRITATHANTGMNAHIDVDVNSLRDVFFLFQVHPARVTTLTYTDGLGNPRTAQTNADGILALYEPNGIASTIALRAETDQALYLGTIYPHNLLSGERDASSFQLYPLNTTTMRQVARAELFLTNPDGSPFTGQVTVRGGVFIDGYYAQDAQIGANTATLTSGSEPQVVQLGANGALTVFMDSAQFWSADAGHSSHNVNEWLSSGNDIRYVFEIIPSSTYLPVIVEISGWLTAERVAAAEHVITLEPVAAGRANTPFVVTQTLELAPNAHRDVRRHTGNIGPSADLPEVTLTTTMLLWGEDAAEVTDAWRLDMADDFGIVPEFQNSNVVVHPFSSIAKVVNTLELSAPNLAGTSWVVGSENTGVHARIVDADGTLRRQQTMPFRIVDLSQVLAPADSGDLTQFMAQTRSAAGLPQAGSMDGAQLRDRMIQGMLTVLSSFSFDAGPITMTLVPTQDNTVFTAFIRLGIDKFQQVDYDDNGFRTLPPDATETSFTPGPMDALRMLKGTYLDKQLSDFEEALSGRHRETNVTPRLEGFYEARIMFNTVSGRWEAYKIRGGFNAGVQVGIETVWNAWVGPVPVTASIEFGGGGSIGVETRARYGMTLDGTFANANTPANRIIGHPVNDRLTELRIDGFVRAFAGLGFDYSIVALKIGIFGEIEATNINRFLARDYLENENNRRWRGQALELRGRAGIRFFAKFLFFSYETILASAGFAHDWSWNDWARINQHWRTTGSGLDRAVSLVDALNADSPFAMAAALGAMPSLDDGEFIELNRVAIQSREYLGRFARSWGQAPAARAGIAALAADSMRAVDGTSAVEQLAANVYPFANPVATTDGHHLLYLHDMDSANVEDVRVLATQRSGGTYASGAPISDGGYGDSNLALAGDANFAIAAWVRQFAPIGSLAGDSISFDEMVLMANATEIMVATNGGAGWQALRLTDNSLADLSPVVATNGEQAIVVWRSLGVCTGTGHHGDEFGEFLDFSAQDHLMFSRFDGVAWSEPTVAYNGTAGAVMGVDVAMLPDGTAIVGYTLNRGEATDVRQDVATTVIGADGTVGRTQIIENEMQFNENPQLASVTIAGEPHAVLAWHTSDGAGHDVRLAAVNAHGVLNAAFPESIAQATNFATLTPQFGFVKTPAGAPVTDLAVWWAQPDDDYDLLRAVSFRNLAGGGYGFTGVLDVIGRSGADAAAMVGTSIDHVSAWRTGDTVHAVIQGSRATDQFDPTLEPLQVPLTEARLFIVSETFGHEIALASMSVDLENLFADSITPIQFSLFNRGKDVIDSATVAIGGEEFTFDGLDLDPNRTSVLTALPRTGERIENLPYVITANFADGGQSVLSGIVHLEFPDIGVSQLFVIQEEDGYRRMLVTLHNASASPLVGSSLPRNVRVGFFENAAFDANAALSVTVTGGLELQDDLSFTVPQSAHALIDDGAFTFEVIFDVAAHMGANNEIGAAGVPFFVHTWLEAGESLDRTDGPSAGERLPEVNLANNTAQVVFDSLLGRHGDSVLLAVDLATADCGTATTALVSAQNLSLAGPVTGTLTATLIDADGYPLETVALPNRTLGPEATISESIEFAQLGARVVLSFTEPVDDESCADLVFLNFDGLPVNLDSFVVDSESGARVATIDTELAATLVAFATRDPRATVRINAVQAEHVMFVATPRGRTVIAVEVTSVDESVTNTWILQVNSTYDSPPRFIDVPRGSPFFEEIEWLAAYGVTLGYYLGDDVREFRPGNSVHRGALAAFFYRLAGQGLTGGFVTPSTPRFVDVPVGAPFFREIEWFASVGISTGYPDRTFRPANFAHRGAIAAFMYRFAGLAGDTTGFVTPNEARFVDVPVGAPFFRQIEWMAYVGVTTGYPMPDGTRQFRPGNNVHRGAMAAFMFRMVQRG